MDAGDLVPDELVIAMILEKIERGGRRRLPARRLPAHRRPGRRARRGARASAAAGSPPRCSIDAPDDEIVLQRLSGRRAVLERPPLPRRVRPAQARRASATSDGTPLDPARRRQARDGPASASTTYHEQTEPLIDYYEERGLLRRFDGTRAPDEVHDHIRATLATLRLEETSCDHQEDPRGDRQDGRGGRDPRPDAWTCWRARSARA